MKLLAYVFLMLTCLINWLVSAYKPISQYFTTSRKSTAYSSSQQILSQKIFSRSGGGGGGSGFHKSPSSYAMLTLSLMKFIPQNGINSQTALGVALGRDATSESNSHHMNSFNTILSFLTHSDHHQNQQYLSSQSRNSNIAMNDLAHDVIDGQLVGFMDYDPKTAAILSHKTSSHNLHSRRRSHSSSSSSSSSRSGSWFSI